MNMPGGAKPHALVVDDDLVVRIALVDYLEEAGFAPTQAAATSSAFADTLTELLSTVATKHDLALMELRMTVKLGGMLAAAVGLTAALTKLL